MRDIFLVVAVLIGLGFTIRSPFVGILLWVWFSIMSPQSEAFGFSQTLPLNFIIAAVTFLSWVFSKEPKHFPVHPIPILLLVFFGWTTFNSFFAFAPDFSWPYWDRLWKILALGIMISCLATNKVRIEALLWCVAVSLMYFGVKGGIFTILTGGSYRVYGPPGTIIADNNQLALALLMVLPIIEYLRSTVKVKWLSFALLACMVLTGISVLGSYSRGAIVAMAVLAVIAGAQSKRKVAYLAAIASFAIAALLLDHFPFGAGFYAPQLRPIFNSYFPGEFPHAAHSIYFQVLGEHGYIGLAIYLGILITAVLSCRKLARLKVQDPGTEWIPRLAKQCFSSIVAFAVGGALLSMAYYDLFIVVICLVPPLFLIANSTRARRGKRSTMIAPALQAVVT
jgi:putative inorganic carbon (HCO3(-)) transporter